MKNQLSNMLLAGVIASTFLMVNCQKAPSKAVKADVKEQGKTGSDVAVIVACNDAAAAALGQRSTDLAALKAEYDKAAPSVYGADGKPKADASIDAATAEGIRKLQEALTASQASVEQAIGALKDAAGNAATGCSLKTKVMNEQTKKEEEKQQDLALEALKAETNSLMSATSGLLKYEAGKASTDTSVATDEKETTEEGGAAATDEKKEPVSIEKAVEGSKDVTDAASGSAVSGSSDLSSSDLSSSDLSSSDLSSGDGSGVPQE